MPTSSELVKRLDSFNFPSAPAVLTKLSGLLGQDSITIEALGEVVALDTGITARALRLANSVFFRGGGGVKSIPEAVLRIGSDGVRDIILALSVMRAIKPVHFDHRPFWRHSLAVAQTTQLLQRRALNLVSPLPESYTAGLLHDIGMLVIDRTLGAEYRPVLDTARKSGRPLFAVERERFGTEHAEVGARLLDTWKLPAPLVAAVRAHHEPKPASGHCAALVHLADFVCNQQGIDHGTGFRPETCASGVWDELGVAEAALPAIANEMQEALNHAEAYLAES